MTIYHGDVVADKPWHEPRHEPFDPLTDSQHKFQKKLEEARDEIIKAAKGRVCGNCKFFMLDRCDINISVTTDTDLECSDDSVACKKFKRR